MISKIKKCNSKTLKDIKSLKDKKFSKVYKSVDYSTGEDYSAEVCFKKVKDELIIVSHRIIK